MTIVGRGRTSFGTLTEFVEVLKHKRGILSANWPLAKNVRVSYTMEFKFPPILNLLFDALEKINMQKLPARRNGHRLKYVIFIPEIFWHIIFELKEKPNRIRVKKTHIEKPQICGVMSPLIVNGTQYMMLSFEHSGTELNVSDRVIS
jgi:hypothetical protein